MNEAFHRDYYSRCFNVLRYLGHWNTNGMPPLKYNLFLMYRFLVFINNMQTVIGGLIDLKNCGSDMKKIAYNLCITSLCCGVTVKNYYLMILSPRLDKLRLKLYKYTLNVEDPEDIAIIKYYKSYLVFIAKTFLAFIVVCLPLRFISSIVSFWRGPRELPFPVYFPWDINNNVYFILGFLYQIEACIFIISQATFADLGMFSIMLPLTAQYAILSKNYKKIGKIYDEYEFRTKESKKLMKERARKILTECVTRQLELLECSKELEYCYNIPMAIQLLTGTLLSVGNLLELILVSIDFSWKISYQYGYTFIVFADMYMVCYFGDQLLKENEKIRSTLYNLPWYNMENDIKKDLLLASTGSQKLIYMTAGKMIKINLPSYLSIIKNIYSWLAMFRQVILKK